MADVIFSGDNGVVAFLIFLAAIIWVFIKQNRKYYLRRLRKMYLKIEKKKKYRRYCKKHQNEITALMERREKIEADNLKKAVYGIR